MFFLTRMRTLKQFFLYGAALGLLTFGFGYHHSWEWAGGILLVGTPAAALVMIHTDRADPDAARDGFIERMFIYSFFLFTCGGCAMSTVVAGYVLLVKP